MFLTNKVHKNKADQWHLTLYRVLSIIRKEVNVRFLYRVWSVHLLFPLAADSYDCSEFVKLIAKSKDDRSQKTERRAKQSSALQARSHPSERTGKTLNPVSSLFLLMASSLASTAWHNVNSYLEGILSVCMHERTLLSLTDRNKWNRVRTGSCFSFQISTTTFFLALFCLLWCDTCVVSPLPSG